MAKLFIKIFILIMTGILILLPVSLTAQTENTPASLAVALTLKLAAFEKNIASQENVTIFVLGAPDVAVELQNVIGSAIGKATLTAVSSGDTLPEQPPSLLFVGSEADINQAVEYAKKHNILSITGVPQFASKGVILGIGIGTNGKPVVTLNLTSTIEAGISWNPAIMKIAKTIK